MDKMNGINDMGNNQGVNKIDNYGFALQFPKGSQNISGHIQLFDVKPENVRPSMVIFGWLHGQFIMRVLKSEDFPLNLGRPAEDYQTFCEEYAKLENSLQRDSAPKPTVTGFVNDIFTVRLESVRKHEDAELCGAKSHVCIIKLTYPKEANPGTREKCHEQVVVAQCGNYLLLKNGTICWTNWFCLKHQSAPLCLLPDYGREDLKNLCSMNKKQTNLSGQHEEGFCYLKPAAFMGHLTMGYTMDCRQCKTVKELVTIRTELLNK